MSRHSFMYIGSEALDLRRTNRDLSFGEKLPLQHIVRQLPHQQLTIRKVTVEIDYFL